MPSKEVTFTINLPVKSVWSFMTDRPEVGCLFPGCKGVKILNDLDSIWTIRMSLGPFSRTIEMKAHTTELVEQKRMSWTATHEHLSLRASLRSARFQRTKPRSPTISKVT